MKMLHTVAALALGAAVTASIAACDKSGSAPAGDKGGPKETTTSSPASANVDMAAAKTVFSERCSACHGASGHGDGPGASALNPKPRAYTDKAWQSSVTDEQIKKTILLGGAAVGKSPIMPASPDLESKPAVVDGLVKLIREFGK
jgi:mono/diheme cytochrome c family protein